MPTARTEPRRRHGRKHSQARHQSSASSEDSSKTDLLHLGSGRGMRVQGESRYQKESIIMRAHRPEEPADIRRAKTAKGVTGSPNQKGIERWAMPTWCHMFNSTLTGNARVWFDKLPKESIDSYEDLRAAFRENYRQQTKHIKDPVEIHHIKQRDGESTEDFMGGYKEEVLDVEGAPKCMKISGFMHGITHPELIKRLYEKNPKVNGRNVQGNYVFSTRGGCRIQSWPEESTHAMEATRRGKQT
ncbi:reverse transcriptase domain-containing protein [Tanacetum coccineum]